MLAPAPTHSSEEFSFVDLLLEKQRQPTAVEKFAQAHDADSPPLQARYYRDLLPATPPGEGEQYAFEVDLDACSGCKSCVAACHNLNGLEEQEMWRNVGVLQGGTAEFPVLQHVTSACHHCLEPACLHGCPVAAYEKDPQTGIVRHLDDQCIGCQYCMLKCPYDVPKYSKSKGIVRKCDMCSDRLSSGEAPACVQSCPNQAIRIAIVDQQHVIEESEANVFVPGAAAPSYTVPTTVYKSERSLPRNLLPADYFSASPQHSHIPLVVMLVLTQMSVGAFAIEQLLSASVLATELAQARFVQLGAALSLGVLGLLAAVFHLGRPLYAFRAIIGLRTSWLSREILAFGAFAGLATAYVADATAATLGFGVPVSEGWLGVAAAASGVFAVLCSVMIYVDTQRPFWSPWNTITRFLGTSVILGLPVALLVSLLAAAWSTDLTVDAVLASHGHSLCRGLIAITACKLAVESLVFARLYDRRHTALKRTALLMTGDLGMPTLARFFFGIIGGVVLPMALLSEYQLAPDAGFHPLFVGIVAVLIVVLSLIGELLERYLFFTAVVVPKMPGVQAN